MNDFNPRQNYSGTSTGVRRNKDDVVPYGIEIRLLDSSYGNHQPESFGKTHSRAWNKDSRGKQYHSPCEVYRGTDLVSTNKPI